MALQVWLPLNGNLNNQGLADTTTVNNGATVDDNGKIGKCYSFDGNDDFINLGSIGSYFDGSAFSICFWIYSLENKTRAAVFSGYGLSSTSNFFGLEINSSNTNYRNNNLRFDWLGSDTYSPDDFVTYNAWTHICVTYDGVNQIKMYKNGALIQTSTRVLNAIPVGNTYYLGRDSRTGSTAFNGKLNDFRIYDHCLSPRECKQVSTALVLHYPLSMPGQENLQQGTTSIGATNVPGWVSNGGGTTLEKIDGNIIHFKRTISDSKVIPTIVLNCVTPCDFNSSYVYSIDLKFDRDIITTGSTPAHFWCGARNTDSIFNTSCNGNLSNRSSSIISPSASTVIPANTWYTQKVRINFGDGPTSEGYDYPAIRCFVYGSVLTENYTGEVNGWMKNCKIEEGEIATPWIPNPADPLYSQLGLDDGVEYDVSGFGNNGTKVGDIIYLSDSPRYFSATHFSAEDQKIHISNFPTSGFGDSYSFAWWAKVKSFGPMHWGFSDGIRLNGMYTGCLWNTGDSSSNPLYIPGTTTQVTAPSTNVWHHYVMTGDGTICKVYLDGVLWAEAKTYKSISGTSIFINGWSSSTQYSSNDSTMSDFRIYATALSADAVKELYHTSASLADNGTLMAY